MTTLINDIKQSNNGYFTWNPLYKAHKFIQKTPNGPKIHDPNMRPVINCLNSSLEGFLNGMTVVTTKMIHIIQTEYGVVNVIQGTYHMMDEYEYYKNIFGA